MANDVEKRITAKMVLDSSGFNNSLKGVNSQLAMVQSEFKAGTERLVGFGKETEKLKYTSESLSKQIDIQRQKVDIWSQSMQKTTEKMNGNIKARDELKDKLKDLGMAHQEIIKQYGKESEEAGKSRAELKALGQEYKNKGNQIESNAKQINYYTTQMNKADEGLVKMENQLKQTNAELAKSENKWLGASAALKESGEHFQKVGSTASAAGDKILRLSAPLIGVGIAAAKVGMDFDSQMSRVKAISEATGDEFEKLKKQALELGASTSFSAKQSAQGMENLASAGFNVTEIMQAMPGMLDLAASSGEDLANSADIAASTLRGFGLAADKAGHVADVLAKNASATNAAVSDTGEAMKYVAPLASSMGRSLEEVTAAIGIMANAGIKGSQAGTTLRGALSRLADPSKEAAGAMKEIGFNAFDSEGKLVSLKDLIERLGKSTESLTDKQKQQAISTIFGQEAMSGMLTLIKAGPQELDKLTQSLLSSDGAAKNMANTMQDNAKASVEQMMGSLETAGIKLGQSLAPTIIKVADSIGKLADKFAALPPETQETILKTAALTVGLGGVLKVGGGVISTVGSIAGGLSKLTGAMGIASTATGAVGAAGAVAGGTTGMGALAGGLGAATLAVAPWLLAGAAVVGVGYGIHKAMSQEVVPSVDLFADSVEHSAQAMENFEGKANTSMTSTVISISEGTKQAVGAYMELDNGVKAELDSLYINSTTITDEIKNTTTAKFNEMSNMVIEGYRKQKDTAIQETTELFNQTKSITDTEQQEILTSMNQYYIDQETTVNNAETQIKSILDRASAEHRELTQSEYETVTMWRGKMKEKSISALSENEVEAKIILQRMKDYDGRVTAEQAAQHISKLNESRDKAVATANSEYEKRIALIEKMKSEGVIKSQEQADKMIAEAKRQKDGIIENAERTRMDAIEKMRGMNSDLEKQVDTSTGKILNWWDKLKRWWNGWKPENKNFSYEVNPTARRGQSSSAIDGNWTGNRSFQGGLTTLHEKGYEVYDLPRSTRIYNHEASEDLVMKTAESVASKVASSVLDNMSFSGNGEQTIIIPVNIDGREISRLVAPYVNEELGFIGNKISLSYGRRP
ncbi:phage tail tape measure protein [Clostridium tunisiense]|uniref:phage tail tape measure protein n=1 Tax=Clostridium tunisiense TaxID=219748 RepID=UPI0003128FB2|nr:phage tail tape measure protein [Clostridium tunisiense]